MHLNPVPTVTNPAVTNVANLIPLIPISQAKKGAPTM